MLEDALAATPSAVVGPEFEMARGPPVPMGADNSLGCAPVERTLPKQGWILEQMGLRPRSQNSPFVDEVHFLPRDAMKRLAEAAGALGSEVACEAEAIVLIHFAHAKACRDVSADQREGFLRLVDELAVDGPELPPQPDLKFCDDIVSVPLSVAVERGGRIVDFQWREWWPGPD